MTFLKFAIIILIGAAIYSCLMINYSKTVLDLKNDNIFAFLSIILVGISCIYIALSKVPIVITYIYILFIVNCIYYFIFKGKLYIKIFVASNFVFYLLTIRGIVLSIESIYLNKSMYEVIIDSRYYKFSLVLLLISMILFFKIFTIMYSSKKISKLHQREIWMLIAVQLILDTMLMILSFVYYYNEYMIWLNFYHTVLCIISLVGFYLLFIYSVDRSNLIESELKLEMFEKQLNRQLKEYYSQMDYIDKLRSFKHDYYKINEALFNLIELGDLERIKKFVKDLNNTVEDIDIKYTKYSNHPLVQAICFAASEYCSLNNINFDAQVIFPEKINLTDLDICRVFDNMIKNSIEACILVGEPNLKNIKISSRIHDYWFTIVGENTFDGNIQIKNGKFLTRKIDKDNHGFGTKTILNVVESRNGLVKYSIDRENNIFELNIHIPLDIKY